jgi:hypothetical protein
MAPPAKPVGLTALFGSSTSVRLTWAASVGTPAQIPTTMSVWIQEAPDTKHWALAAQPRPYDNGADSWFVDLVDLQPQTTYRFKLLAANYFGQAWSDPIVFTTTTYLAAP